MIDWHSRRVLSWRLSLTLEEGFCLAALEEALAHFGRPAIFNTDQGSQFTAVDFTERLLAAGIQISRDGRGRALDNVFVERLWRSLKVEEVYLRDYASAREARDSIARWFDFYNRRRPDQSLDYLTLAAVYAETANGTEALIGYWTLKILAFSSNTNVSYRVSVRRASDLPAASFRSHLAMGTLPAG